MKWVHLFLGCLLSLGTGCSLLEAPKTKSPHYVFEIVPASQNRTLASPNSQEKTVIVKKCSEREENCLASDIFITYKDFAEQLQKKVALRSYVSQQVSLLEQQAASLRIDREILQNEIFAFDRSLKDQPKSSTNHAAENIRRLRASLLLEIAEIEQKILLTENDLHLLKQPLKNKATVNQDAARLLEMIESGAEFGSSLQYRDNLIAQVFDSIAQEML